MTMGQSCPWRKTGSWVCMNFWAAPAMKIPRNSEMFLVLPERNGWPRILWHWFGRWGREVCPGRIRYQQHLSMTCSQQVLQSVMKSSVAPLGGNRRAFSPMFHPPCLKKTITKTPASLLIQMCTSLSSMVWEPRDENCPLVHTSGMMLSGYN